MNAKNYFFLLNICFEYCDGIIEYSFNSVVENNLKTSKGYVWFTILIFKDDKS